MSLGITHRLGLALTFLFIISLLALVVDATARQPGLAHALARRQTTSKSDTARRNNMAANFKNEDGTVNLDGVKAHLDHVKGKYAQNAKNYEANTGKKMNLGGQEVGQEAQEGKSAEAPEKEDDGEKTTS